jgi:hypothetical protein
MPPCQTLQASVNVFETDTFGRLPEGAIFQNVGCVGMTDGLHNTVMCFLLHSLAVMM